MGHSLLTNGHQQTGDILCPAVLFVYLRVAIVVAGRLSSLYGKHGGRDRVHKQVAGSKRRWVRRRAVKGRAVHAHQIIDWVHPHQDPHRARMRNRRW
jgi:hypothetical protein